METHINLIRLCFPFFHFFIDSILSFSSFSLHLVSLWLFWLFGLRMPLHKTFKLNLKKKKIIWNQQWVVQENPFCIRPLCFKNNYDERQKRKKKKRSTTTHIEKNQSSARHLMKRDSIIAIIYVYIYIGNYIERKDYIMCILCLVYIHHR